MICCEHPLAYFVNHHFTKEELNWVRVDYNTRHKSLKQTPFLSNFLEKS